MEKTYLDSQIERVYTHLPDTFSGDVDKHPGVAMLFKHYQDRGFSVYLYGQYQMCVDWSRK